MGVSTQQPMIQLNTNKQNDDDTLRHHVKKGFTTLELALVAGVVGIIAALVIPAFSYQLSRISLRSTSREIKAVFDLAKQYAISLDRPVEVSLNFTADGKSVSKFYILDTSPPPSGDAVLEEYTVMERLIVTSNPTIGRIRFDPIAPVTFKDKNGMTISSPSNFLRIQNAENATKDVVIFPTTKTPTIRNGQ